MVHRLSLVVKHGLSFPVACGLLVPTPGMEPASPAVEGGLLTTGQPGKSLELFDFYFHLLGWKEPLAAISSSKWTTSAYGMESNGGDSCEP